MGCDGGTIPRRDELVRLKKKPEQKDKDADREFRWLHCAINQQRLQEPIVMCGLGRLYSKQNVIENLLEKDKMPEAAKHIKSMKDIKQLNICRNPVYTEEEKTGGSFDSRHSPYICKLIGLEMSGKFRFVAFWSCGCVLSERALKEIKSSYSCPLCQQPFTMEDIVVLNSTEEDLELMKVKMQMRQTKKKNKKDKILKNTKVNGTNMAVKDEAKSLAESIELPSTSKLEITDNQLKIDDGISSSSQSTKTKIVANPKRLGVATGALEDPEIKRLKTDYSVAKDPKASDVYKSLFTSHRSEQEQTRAHWVTYNPFYN